MELIHLKGKIQVWLFGYFNIFYFVGLLPMFWQTTRSSRVNSSQMQLPNACSLYFWFWDYFQFKLISIHAIMPYWPSDWWQYGVFCRMDQAVWCFVFYQPPKSMIFKSWPPILIDLHYLGLYPSSIIVYLLSWM